MQKLILLTCALIGFSSLAFSQSNSEYAGVEKAINYYLDGGTNNDFETLAKAFHADATMQFIRNGEHRSVNAIAFFKGVMKPGPKQNRITRISQINVFGTSASARVEIDYTDSRIVDQMNLLKIDGEWKIVSKIFDRSKMVMKNNQ